MQKLTGHWVAKRTGILEHYKSMTLAEIVLFDAYLLLANKQTWECWRSIRQLEKLLPMKRHTIIKAKRALIDRGWIQKINQTGVFIPKLYRYSHEVLQTGQHSVANGTTSGPNGTTLDERGGANGTTESAVWDNGVVQTGQQKVPFGTTIIEDGIIIEDDYLLGRSEKPENARLCQPAQPNSALSQQDRLYLSLLKNISSYPFNFERDLAFIRDLLVDFPTLDLEQEIKAWKVWLLDKNLKGKINYRSRLRRWLKNSIRYRKEKQYEQTAKTPTACGSRPEEQKKGRKGFDLPSDYPIDVGPGKNR